MTSAALQVTGLTVDYTTRSGSLRALDDMNLIVEPGEIVGIVGESGCGKSTLASALLRLLPANGAVTSGRVEVGGRDLLAASREELRELRGRTVGMIFQDPLTSLNPSFTIGAQMANAQLAHSGVAKDADVARTRAAALLSQVGLADTVDQLKRYPHEFSGGMRQRIMIAMALSLTPALLVADEPTSALDVTTAAQILELLRELRDVHGTAILLVSHELGVIAQTCDRVVVMYAGRVVEQGDVVSIFARPCHPYTRALLGAVPSMRRRARRLQTIPGRVPSLKGAAEACVFADRCPDVRDACHEGEPVLMDHDRQRVRCLRFDSRSDYWTAEEHDQRPRP